MFRVLGIPYQPISNIGNRNCQKLNKYLKKQCKLNDINYLDSYAVMSNKEYFQNDGLHFSTEGHNELGNILYKGMQFAISETV